MSWVSSILKQITLYTTNDVENCVRVKWSVVVFCVPHSRCASGVRVGTKTMWLRGLSRGGVGGSVADRAIRCYREPAAEWPAEIPGGPETKWPAGLVFEEKTHESNVDMVFNSIMFFVLILKFRVLMVTSKNRISHYYYLYTWTLYNLLTKCIAWTVKKKATVIYFARWRTQFELWVNDWHGSDSNLWF